MSASILSQTQCTLGEGPLWHPKLNCLFWFDILEHRLYQVKEGQERVWQFDRAVSAAGWVDETRLLIASERDLFVFDFETEAQTHLVDLEADNPVTRSNDGRADPLGGFWIGTMGYNAEPGAGAIYRFYKGELRKLFGEISISNAICFAPDGKHAFFTDTPTKLIKRVALDADGWPSGEAETWLDLNAEGVAPDGAVIDAAGNFWNAQWGASRVACYDPAGTFVEAVPYPATQISCPAFGGPELGTLFATSAATGLGDEDPLRGQVFAVQTAAQGQQEHQVLL
ncbi:SMP-30/gluconolactonase/LRE family protein [Tropicibacter sp. R15_0]|uniref:SMP-30/gluconolactonase/LRE family protein n=1 Tax=Tropicibacter sp. R15_0 TaxID=2821101 RepID=UPI001ADC712F|nr:SMP-30/gluconolactonase/LRE family protein [Tropicibacter sp. R15_0]MBO9465379.1 SMP-30/gluconolactonase/LRE family protein [Tropicibacter sp. R15_0]